MALVAGEASALGGVHGAVGDAVGVDQEVAGVFVEEVVGEALLAGAGVGVDLAEGDSGGELEAAEFFGVQVEAGVACLAEVLARVRRLAEGDSVLTLEADIVFEVEGVFALGAEEGGAADGGLDVVLVAVGHRNHGHAHHVVELSEHGREGVAGGARLAGELIARRGFGERAVLEDAVERRLDRHAVFHRARGSEQHVLRLALRAHSGLVFVIKAVRHLPGEALIVFQVVAVRTLFADLRLRALSVVLAVRDGSGLTGVVDQHVLRGVALDAERDRLVDLRAARVHGLRHTVLVVRGGDEAHRALLAKRTRAAAFVVEAVFDENAQLREVLVLDVETLRADVQVGALLHPHVVGVAPHAAFAVGEEVQQQEEVFFVRVQVFHVVERAGDAARRLDVLAEAVRVERVAFLAEVAVAAGVGGEDVLQVRGREDQAVEVDAVGLAAVEQHRLLRGVVHPRVALRALSAGAEPLVRRRGVTILDRVAGNDPRALISRVVVRLALRTLDSWTARDKIYN